MTKYFVDSVEKEKVWKDVKKELEYVSSYADPERREELLMFLVNQFKKLEKATITQAKKERDEEIVGWAKEKGANRITQYEKEQYRMLGWTVDYNEALNDLINHITKNSITTE